jgi:hypothetical protein
MQILIIYKVRFIGRLMDEIIHESKLAKFSFQLSLFSSIIPIYFFACVLGFLILSFLPRTPLNYIFALLVLPFSAISSIAPILIYISYFGLIISFITSIINLIILNKYDLLGKKYAMKSLIISSLIILISVIAYLSLIFLLKYKF